MDGLDAVARTSRWARLLDDARLAAREVDRLTREEPALDVAEGYRIQDEGVTLRLERGERIVGWKMGLTSRAKMKQMGVEVPIYGVLTDAMRVADGARFALAGSIHPKIEPEIAFVVARELRGRPSADEALAACAAVYPAMEIIDSRYRNFEFLLPDVVADNCSCSAFVVAATGRAPSEVDVADVRMELSVDGAIAQSGSSAEIYGHPAASLAELVRMLDDQGRALPAGSVVLAGAATSAIPLLAGRTYRLDVHGLGAVSLST